MNTNAFNALEISAVIKEKIKNFKANTLKHEGIILSVADGIVRIYGLSAFYGEVIKFIDGNLGLVLNIEPDQVAAIVLGSAENLAQGQSVVGTGQVLQVPVGEALLGKVVDPLGNPLDDSVLDAKTLTFADLEVVAPGVIDRESINRPLQTGIKAIDVMVPIGKGQRELIIGDRQTGKTSLALDAIINQKNKNVRCIYVAIGQKSSSVAQVVRRLAEYGALEYTIVVVATAATAAALQYIAPYAGCAMGEYFRDKGEDALIVYDDLIKHAWSYRQISLLLRRPPGREAYPGDIFYLHSRLLERAAQVNAAYVAKKTQGKIERIGSLTALPIIETQAGDVSAFIPTNVISITDGQIFLETNLFNAGVRPAINAGLSVSRIGGAAQTELIRKLGAKLRLSMAQYRELSAFSQFAADLDEATRTQLERGQRIVELMKQKNGFTLSVAKMALSLFAIEHAYFDKLALDQVILTDQALHQFAKANYAEELEKINVDPSYTEANLKSIAEIVAQYFKSAI